MYAFSWTHSALVETINAFDCLYNGGKAIIAVQNTVGGCMGSVCIQGRMRVLCVIQLIWMVLRCLVPVPVCVVLWSSVHQLATVGHNLSLFDPGQPPSQEWGAHAIEGASQQASNNTTCALCSSNEAD